MGSIHPTKIIKFPLNGVKVSFRFQTDQVLVEVESKGIMFVAKDVEEAFREVKKKLN